MSNKYENVICPVCGYYCLGKGGFDCIDKPGLVNMVNTQPEKHDPSVSEQDDGYGEYEELLAIHSAIADSSKTPPKENLNGITVEAIESLLADNILRQAIELDATAKIKELQSRNDELEKCNRLINRSVDRYGITPLQVKADNLEAENKQLQDDIERLIDHIAVLSLTLRDDPDCVDEATESFRALPDHLQDTINKAETLKDLEAEALEKEDDE